MSAFRFSAGSLWTAKDGAVHARDPAKRNMGFCGEAVSWRKGDPVRDCDECTRKLAAYSVSRTSAS